MSENKLHGTYNFKEVSLIVGTRQIRGFEDGTEISAARDEDSFNAKADVDGSVTRSRSNNTMGTVEFTLSQFAEDNKYLQTLANLDERTGNGVIPVKVVDKSNPNEEKAVASEAWIVKPSDRSWGRESGPRQWTIRCANLNFD